MAPQHTSADEIEAHHEAGHAVLAVASRLHRLAGDIAVTKSGHGVAFVSLSKQLLLSNNKPDFSEAQKDPEVARDVAVVFLAGFAAEQKFCRNEKTAGNNANENRSAADEDYELVDRVLELAECTGELASLERVAVELVEKHWTEIAKFAKTLHGSPGMTISFDDADRMISV
ncbi:hypothetical protein JYT83_00550 [bacterium AH-315-F18]|nr:hypothetical protein [bacterium AH-315-F18]